MIISAMVTFSHFKRAFICLYVQESLIKDFECVSFTTYYFSLYITLEKFLLQIRDYTQNLKIFDEDRTNKEKEREGERVRKKEGEWEGGYF